MIAPLRFAVVLEHKGINTEEDHNIIEKELNVHENWSETYGMDCQYSSDVKESDCTPGFYQARYFKEIQKAIKTTYKELVGSSCSI